MNYFNKFNKDFSVYPSFVKRNSTNEDPLLVVTDKPDDKLKPDEINKVETPDQRFQAIKTHSDPETGFDGMAVAPLVNGKPDYSSVAVTVAGTDPESEVNRPPLGIVSRDVASAIEARQGFLSPQYPVLDRFVQENPYLLLI